jgi:glycosyltransferase involved in cell wall biosynthesis
MVGDFIRKSKVINENFDTRYINLGTSATVDDIGKSPISKIFKYINIVWQTVVQISVFRPDNIYVALTAKGIGFYKDAFIILLAKLMGGSMVYHLHNKGVSTKQEKPFDNWLYKKVFKNAEVILLSEYLYPDIKKYVSRDRVHICPNGIPEQMDQKVQHAKVKKGDPVQLLFLSNLIESKGVFVLLEACGILKKKGITFECAIVGGEGGITSKQLNKKINELGLEENVFYLGKKYNEDKKRIFLASDIFVFPTFYETFGLVNLEAMQASLPVISTPEGGIPDVVLDRETGYLAPQKNAEALAQYLEHLINNPDKREKMGIKGRERYEKYFTIQAFENRLSDILQTI